MAKKAVSLIPDTNALIHYRFFEIVWRDLLGVDEVTICLCPQVIHEVASLKDMAEKKGVRKRAAALVSKINEITKGQNTLRNGEEITVHARRPDLTRWSHLNEKSQDDLILGFALDLKEQSAGEVLVVTADVSLNLRIRLHEIGLKELEIPHEMRLELADEEDKQIKRLEEELNGYKRAQPKLTAEFENGSTVLKVAGWNEAQLREITSRGGDEAEAEARKKHPLRVADSSLGALYRMSMSFGEPWTEDEIRDFNAKLVGYYRSLNEYEKRAVGIAFRTFKIDLRVGNGGTQPANSVLIRLNFPDGFTVCDEKGLQDIVGKKPSPPMTDRQRFSENLHPELIMSPFLRHHAATAYVDGEMTIRQSNGYQVEIEYEKIRQGEFKSPDTLYAVFDSQVRSFTFDYEIVADNAAASSKGRLSMVIELDGAEEN